MNFSNRNIELLSAEKILAQIEPSFRDHVREIEILETVDSTNTHLLKRAKEPASNGIVCFAEEQTNGRGRLGKRWFSPRYSNIYCSLLWRFENLENISGLSIAVAVIIATALKKYGISELQLKWPNDILIANRKLSGILLEATGKNVVIGIGINLFLPEDADPSWIGLEEVLSKQIERNRLAGLLLNELFMQLPIFETQGLKAFLPFWREHDSLINNPIVLTTPTETFSGIMKGINDQGQLLLENDTGVVTSFSYGEASVRYL